MEIYSYIIYNTIKKHLIPAKNFIFGISDLKGLIDEQFAGFRYGISIGKRLDDNIIDGIENGPTIEYFDYYKQINSKLADLAMNIKTDLLEQGVNSIVIEPSIKLDAKENEQYFETLTVDVSHKMVATRAGLGWIGKTDLFVSNAFGPRLRLVSILIDQKPEIISKPIEASQCGKCDICVVKCPAKAANGLLWNVNIHRDEFFDAHSCRDKCGELAIQKLNIDERICGLCVSVCPIGKKKSK